MSRGPRLSGFDIAQRVVVWSCLALTGYGCLLTAHGVTVRFMRRSQQAEAIQAPSNIQPLSPFSPDSQPQQPFTEQRPS